MKFYTGIRVLEWITYARFPVMLSFSYLDRHKYFPHAHTDWVLDSGAFTEISTHGRWRTTAKEYARKVRSFSLMGRLDWVAQQDWMCEPFILKKTHKTVLQHQNLTVQNYIELKPLIPNVIPVLQGYTMDDYKRCIDLFYKQGVDLVKEPTVGLGSVCRRQKSDEIVELTRWLRFQGFKLHGFGLKQAGLIKGRQYLKSADSQSWALEASHLPPLPECKGLHLHCSTCYRFALAWTRKIQSIWSHHETVRSDLVFTVSGTAA